MDSPKKSLSPTTDASRRALVVVGMHRSGTSAMTRMLSLLGAALPNDLMESHPDNPEGFWEPQSVADLNDEILHSLDSEWDDVFAFRPRPYLSNFDTLFVARAAGVLESEFNGSEVIALKDPRVSVLTAFWDRALRSAGYAPNYIIVVRNPLEVAESLRVRNSFPREKSLLLWSSYMLAAERDTRALSRIFVSYDDLMRDWRGVRTRLETATGFPFPRDTAAAGIEIDRFLNPTLRHHVSTGDELFGREDVPEHVKTLYRLFSQACGSRNSSRDVIDYEAVDAIRAELSKIESMVGPLVADLRTQTRTLEKDITSARESQLAADGRAQQLAEELVTERTRAAEALADNERERDALAGEIAALNARVSEDTERNQSQLAEIEALNARLSQETEQSRSQLAEIGKLRGAVSLRESELRQRQEEIEQTLANLQQANSKIQSLEVDLAAAERRVEAEQEISRDRAELQRRLHTREAELVEALARHRAIEARRDELAETLERSRLEVTSAEQRLNDRSREVEKLTQLASEAQASDRRSHEQLEWLSSTTSILLRATKQPGWRSLPLSAAGQRAGGIRRLLKEEGLFDADAYLAANPDVATEGADPLQHYLMHGIYENRPLAPVAVDARELRTPALESQDHMGGGSMDPQPTNRGGMALSGIEHQQVARDGSSRRDAAASRVESLQHRRRIQLAARHDEVRRQVATARSAISAVAFAAPTPRRRSTIKRLTAKHPLAGSAIFDRLWIQHISGKPAPSFSGFLRDAKFHQVDPHPLFAAAMYLQGNPDVAESGISPLQHYLEHGWREGRNPHPYFENDWYLEQNPDVLEAGINPLEHYLRLGWREGRFPNPMFDPAAYLDWNPDVKDAGMEPLTHFVMYGRAEGREFPFHGFEKDWRSLLPHSSEAALMDVILGGIEPVKLEAECQPAELGEAWPPKPLNAYWLPQRLRDLILETYDDKTVGLYSFLCSIMDAYSEHQDEFAKSDVCTVVLERLRTRSAERAKGTQRPPAASIIIPVYDNFLDTVLCLASILEHEADSSFEIIVADDQSGDATGALLPTIDGVVRHFRQPKNLGFLGNCNSAAEQAQGGVIVLLNNDTLVLPGWLDALISPFERSELVGLVGSKLINGDGTLQEAGGIFWQDGSAWNFGRGQDARAPEFNYLKEVDYCSGASIAVPSALWRQLGGFDTAYAPAYCEDSDIAFRIRAAGYRTLYNPHSEVIHHEGRSHGRDLGSGIKAYQVRNQQRLFERWGDLLRSEHFPNAQNVLRARDRSSHRIHVLMIDHYVPQWDQDAGSRTIYQYLQILLDLGIQVTFWPDNLYRDPVYTPVLQSMGVEVVYGPKFRGGFESFIKDRADLYDAVFVSRPHVAPDYLAILKAHTSARILYYGHDLHFKRMEASRAVGEDISIERISEMRKLELGVCEGCDVIFYPDPEEIKAVAEEVGGDRTFIANPVFVYDDVQIEAGRQRVSAIPEVTGASLFFVGGFNHTPNRLGITWFVTEVLPLIWEQVPDARLDIAGSNPPPDVKMLASERVAVLGRISDEALYELYGRAALAVAPLLYGAGVKGKVIEAMAYGVPVATTSVGAQGIEVGERGLFVGDDPQQLAGAIVQALRDRKEAQRRADRSLDFIKRHYGRTAMTELFRRLIVEHVKT